MGIVVWRAHIGKRIALQFCKDTLVRRNYIPVSSVLVEGNCSGQPRMDANLGCSGNSLSFIRVH